MLLTSLPNLLSYVDCGKVSDARLAAVMPGMCAAGALSSGVA